MTPPIRPGEPPDLGERLGRIALRSTNAMSILHTSARAGWDGAFMTHVHTPKHFAVQGSWSWIRLSLRLSQAASNFPQTGGGATASRAQRLQVGLPGVTYSGSWAIPTESASLFIDPSLFERVAHASCPADAVTRAARHLHTDSITEHLLQVLLADIQVGSPGGASLGESVIALILPRLAVLHTEAPALLGARLSAAELRRLRAYVRDHLSTSIHLADMATSLSISPRHLCRVMQTTLGITPHRFIIDCRIEHATQLLTSGRIPCSEIAVMSGFADHRHMSTTFRRILNVTPLQIRHSQA